MNTRYISKFATSRSAGQCQRMVNRALRFFICCLAWIGSACSHATFLDEIPNPSLVIPQTLPDYQAILDQDRIMNGNLHNGVMPTLGEMGTDDYLVRSDMADNLLVNENENIYTWNATIFESRGDSDDWSFAYRTIFYANTVLDGLASYNGPDRHTATYDQIRASAHFFRAFAMYQLAQLFAPPYPLAGAEQLQGLPMRLSSDINETLHRGNLAETYQQMIDDLTEAIPALPATAAFKTRPAKSAAFAMLSRLYMNMHQYESAKRYADSCLLLHPTLLDYNNYYSAGVSDYNYPFVDYKNNHEILFYATMVNTGSNILLNPFIAAISEQLYAEYDAQDLRKLLFYKREDWGIRFYGSYGGSSADFCGLTTAEVYLNRAECLLQMGRLNDAMIDLNALRKKRYHADHDPALHTDQRTVALEWIRSERRKELIRRGLRWTDVRRWNAAGENIVMQRPHKGVQYTLAPNDGRNTYPIPPDIMAFNPNFQQNIR